MKQKFVEVTHTDHAKSIANWGKFLLLQFDEEYTYASRVEMEYYNGRPEEERALQRALHKTFHGGPAGMLLGSRGWGDGELSYTWVLDLETREGVCVRPGGCAAADLERHKIWVCPMFEPFLAWFYRHKEYHNDILSIPDVVYLSHEEAPFADRGYRRGG